MNAVAGWQHWWYEWRQLGWGAILAPVAAVAGLCVLAVLARAAGLALPVSRVLSAGLDILPMIGGLTAASLVNQDGALELQLSLPIAFRNTLLRRVALALGWTGLIALMMTTLLALTGQLAWPVGSLAASQLIWLAPMLWLSGLGTAVSLLSGAGAMGSGGVAVLWVLEQALREWFASSPWLAAIWLFQRYAPEQPSLWWGNRLVLVISGLALLVLAYELSGRSERLLLRQDV